MTNVVGLVPLGPREALAMRPLNGVPLLVHAIRALRVVTGSATTVVALDRQVAAEVLASNELAGVDVWGYAELGSRLDTQVGSLPAYLVHDPLCPLVSARDIAGVARLGSGGGGAAAVLVVTDTVKRVRHDAGRTLVAGTVDRARLRRVGSPVLIPGRAVAGIRRRLGDRTWLDDLGAVVRALRSMTPVSLVEMPTLGRRVDAADSLLVLESLTAGRSAAHKL